MHCQEEADGCSWGCLCLVATEGLLLTDAKAQGQLVSSPQLPVEAEQHLEGLPTPHHQVLDVERICVVLLSVLALQKVNPSDLQTGLWKERGEKKRLVVIFSVKTVVFFLMQSCESSKYLE